MPPVIDVWNVQTFDHELLAVLGDHAQEIVGYFQTDHDIFLAYDNASGPNRPIMRPDNPYAPTYYGLLDTIGELMASRTIRTFHYTRLTDNEVADLLRLGIHLSTPATLRSRLDALVAAGALAAGIADQLYEASPFNSDQRDARSDKFWMVSHPLATDDHGVTPLMQRWGGEVASFWVSEATLTTPLDQLGKPRVLEIAVPLEATRHSHHAGKAVVATFGRARGAIPEKSAFDLYAKVPLPATAVLAVHTAGDGAFTAIGRSYPPGFIDVDIGRWKELTGEDD